jgi:hypothetical protein
VNLGPLGKSATCGGAGSFGARLARRRISQPRSQQFDIIQINPSKFIIRLKCGQLLASFSDKAKLALPISSSVKL